MSWGVFNAACLCSEKMAAKEGIGAIRVEAGDCWVGEGRAGGPGVLRGVSPTPDCFGVLSKRVCG